MLSDRLPFSSMLVFTDSKIRYGRVFVGIAYIEQWGRIME